MDRCTPLSLRMVEGEMSGRVLSPSSRVLAEQVRVCACVSVRVCACVHIHTIHIHVYEGKKSSYKAEHF